MREVRFSVGPAADEPITNSWGGWPTASSIQPYLVLRSCVEGESDPVTGYLCNITMIDRLIRERSVPLVNRLIGQPRVTGETLIQAIAADLRTQAPNGSRWINWQLYVTPCLSYGLICGASNMIDISQCFEFSAAHRLHCESLSDEENRRTFGKCNNPSGHGHNYAVVITITGEPDPLSGVLMPVSRMEQIVQAQVIDRLDHKHLNRDCPEFAALNPSVENIARVIWDLLADRFAPATLKRIRVWETPKTYAEYEGPSDGERRKT
ncbi:MAG TPA: 6-carboxytetrahydropterin synthase [Phycisphaerae bacterium]|nr:6-carboxytetrahydropterin synthase [Phycisphaerae bacterium]